MSGLPRARTRFGADDFAPIAVAERSGCDESLHYGAGVVLAPDGTRRASIGDPSLAVYARSALKPLQATAMLSLGLDISPELLAVVCASHNGDPEHIDAVRRLLAEYDLTESDLRNTSSPPLSSTARRVNVAAGIEPAPIYMNCSGKHAGMLVTCRINGWPIQSYLDPDHPLQAAIGSTLSDLGAHVDHVGVDGCGAPTHVVSLEQLAGAFATLVGTPVHTAMTWWPQLVGGQDRDVTRWMSAVPGLLAKEGAAAVMAFVLADGTAGAYKIADGIDAVRKVVFPTALRYAGVTVDDLSDALDSSHVSVFGHGEPVGEIRPLEWTWSS